MRPVIGITAYAQHAKWGVWHVPAVLVPLAYVEAVEGARGRAILIPGRDPARHAPRFDRP